MANPYLGEIRLFPYNFAPSGWQFCQGQTLPISQYQALFALIGTTYGGNGVQNFALPDLRGRVVITSGNGPGLSSFVLGESSGTENVTILANQMPSHTHLLNASDATATVTRPGGAALGRTAGATYAPAPDGSTTMSASSIAPAGGNVPISVLQPYLVLNYCIAMVGIFPSRN